MTCRRTATAIGAMLFGAGLFLPAPAMAQFAKAEDAIEYRQSAFKIMGNHMGRLAAMAQGKIAFDAAAAQRSARLVETMSKLPWEGFVPGSHVGDTGAKPALFDNLDDVRKLVDQLNVETAKLPDAASSLDALRGQVGATGKACKACHDKYREKI